MLFSFAGLLFKSGEYAEAREALERLTVLSPDYAGANDLLAMIAGSSNPVTGEKEADQGLNPMAEEARLLKEEGKFEEALAVFSRMAGQAGHSAAADIGDCLANLDRLDEAAVSYRQALKENGNNLKALVGLGVLGLLQGEEEKAAAWFNRALQIDSADARALCGLGMVRNMQNRFEEASALFAGSLDADPEQLPALNGLVGCSYRLERFEEAERRLTNYLMYHPADLDMLFSLAGLCYRAGNLAAARDNLEKVLLFAPDYQGGRELLDKIREQSAA
jgi:tetratricopeptide (TPR) repeat protein